MIILQVRGNTDINNKGMKRMEYQKVSDFPETMGDSMEGTILYHSTFRRNWRRTFEREQSDEKKNDWIRYKTGESVYVYDDFKSILKTMDLHPDNRDKNREKFQEYIKVLPKLILDKEPAPFTWYNTTKNGINLRPGKKGSSSRLPAPIEMREENSHGIIAGTTGSGKSVFINNLILNLMVEYPPWELELYLADFKKVELSRYMNKYAAPHVRACAATSEIDYVQSLIYYIKDRMDDRQKLFARLGYTDIESFREAYPQLVVPRILFIVDEFQQLFLDASSNQKSVIEDLITNITRLGRAQGIHLLFASQDMSGALNQKQLSNFNIRFALLCDASISEDILGNNGATKLKRGQVIAKTKTTNNELFSVPIAIDPTDIKDNEEEYFFRLLKEFMSYADSMNYSYRRKQKFYDEDKQLELCKLEALLNEPQVKKIRELENNEIAAQNYQYFMSMVLGRKVVYSNLIYDIENIFIDYAKNRCLLCLSGNNADLAYFQKLIAVNIRTMINKHSCSFSSVNLDFGIPFFYDLSPSVSSLYPERERIKDLMLKDPECEDKLIYECNETKIDQFINDYFYYRAEEFDELKAEYNHRKNVLSIIRNDKYCNAKEKCIELINQAYLDNKVTDEDERKQRISYLLNSSGLDCLAEDDSNILVFIEKKLNLPAFIQKEIEDLLVIYYRYQILGIRPTYKLFSPILVWITGIEILEKIPGWFEEFISNAMDYNFFVMFFSSSAVDYRVKQASNYIFVSGFDPKLYDDYLNRKMAVGENGLKFYALVKNTNQKFAFKKYRCQMNTVGARFINFDNLFFL